MKQIVKCRIWIGILLAVVLIFAVALYNSEGRLIRGQAQEIGEEALFDDSSVFSRHGLNSRGSQQALLEKFLWGCSDLLCRRPYRSFT